ncbi:hypothetical protein BCU94_18970 [Shewanella sp. 10N.286.52.C2]|nr:hypothetical protein BCU94_18970 [Shewanella sp. 10N.286.52.C2]
MKRLGMTLLTFVIAYFMAVFIIKFGLTLHLTTKTGFSLNHFVENWQLIGVILWLLYIPVSFLASLIISIIFWCKYNRYGNN